MSSYFIYGISAGKDQINYIGCADQEPEEDKEKILSNLKKQNEKVKIWIEDRNIEELEIFKIEEVRSSLEMKEALDFWHSYCHFLSLNLVSEPLLIY
jgi:hypothetical protein